MNQAGIPTALAGPWQAMVEGLTLQKIAGRLNSEWVPTLSGKGQRQKGTVGNLLAQGDEA